MRDLAFVGFLAALLGFGFRRPFLFVLAYAYVDIVAPQHLSYFLLNSIPLSLIVTLLAMGAWALADDKKGLAVAPRQWLMLAILAWAGFTTLHADMPKFAPEKWEWVWKAVFWATFLPLTLRTRLRIESYLLFMTLSAAAIIIVGGIKTAASGGGYGALNLMIASNTGLYEGSTISTVAIAIVPVILWLARYGTIFPRDYEPVRIAPGNPPPVRSTGVRLMVRLFAYNLVFACLLIPVGTEARTGLVCIGVLAILMLRDVKRRLLYMGLIGAAVAVATPMLPESFSSRMQTIQSYKGDSSAASRIAVWAWTWDYAKQHPLGGGFEAYRQNRLQVHTTVGANGATESQVDWRVTVDKGRAYHSSYFEMLGEQGFPGLFMFLLLHIAGLVRMEVLRRRYRREEGEKAWIAPLATALQGAQVIYLTGSLFVGIAFQPFVWMLIGVQIGFDTLVGRKYARATARPFGRPGAAVEATA